jgi:UBX domain-containing protein 7
LQQVSDFNLERAIELFFETGGVDLSGPTPSAPPPPPPARSVGPRTPSPPPIVQDTEELFESDSGSRAPAHDIDEDEALARRLMQEDIDRAPTANNSNDAVRSPIMARNDILVHPDMDYDTHYGYASRRGLGRGRMLPLQEWDVDRRYGDSWHFQSGDTIDME